MSAEYPVPRAAESLLGFFAGPGLQDEILGDLRERSLASGRSPAWYWFQALGSIPPLTRLHIGSLSRERWIEMAGVCLLALGLIWLWEVQVAQAFSWLMAKQILAVSPLGAAGTCKACYVLLYTGALLALFRGLSFWRRIDSSGHHRFRVDTLLVTVIALVPVLYYWVNPGPYDGPKGFRIYQALAVWGVLLASIVTASRGRMRAAA